MSTDVRDVDAFARVLREAALEKAALRHRGLLARVRRVRQPVSVDDDEPVAVGQRLPARVRVVEGRRLGAGRIAREHEHHRCRPGWQRRRRVDEIAPLHLADPQPAHRGWIGHPLHERRHATTRLLRARRPLQADRGLRAGSETKSRRRSGRRHRPRRRGRDGGLRHAGAQQDDDRSDSQAQTHERHRSSSGGQHAVSAPPARFARSAAKPSA